MATAKRYRITKTAHGRFGGEPRVYTQEGTLPELLQAYSYTLETGRSYEHEKGNRRINTNPKSAASLCTALTNASNNAAANGYSGMEYSYEVLPA